MGALCEPFFVGISGDERLELHSRDARDPTRFTLCASHWAEQAWDQSIGTGFDARVDTPRPPSASPPPRMPKPCRCDSSDAPIPPARGSTSRRREHSKSCLPRHCVATGACRTYKNRDILLVLFSVSGHIAKRRSLESRNQPCPQRTACSQQVTPPVWRLRETQCFSRAQVFERAAFLAVRRLEARRHRLASRGDAVPMVEASMR